MPLLRAHYDDNKHKVCGGAITSNLCLIGNINNLLSPADTGNPRVDTRRERELQEQVQWHQGRTIACMQQHAQTTLHEQDWFRTP